MAEPTIQLGGGNWAGKSDNLLGYYKEGERFYKQDFTFSRSTTGTYTDKDGYIQTSAINMPRVDYLNNSNGSLILEPQRSNLLNYSTDFSQSYYTKSQVTITSNDTTSPDGTQNSDKVVETTSNSEHIFYRTGISTLGTISIYAKADNSGRLFQIRRDGGSGTNSWSWFNLDNGTVVSQDAGVASIESLSNNWYRCVFTPTNANGTIVFAISNGATTRSVSYEGNGTSGVYIYGAQLEAGSYPTTLINTSGSSVTRNADACNITNVADRIGQTEGVIFVDFKKEHNGVETWSINDGTSQNRVYMGFNGTNFISQVRSSGGAAQASFTTALSNNTRYKCALAYKLNDFVLYINGVQIGSDNSGVVPLNMSNLAANASTNSDAPFFSPTNDVKLYNTRLSNSELATLTT